MEEKKKFTIITCKKCGHLYPDIQGHFCYPNRASTKEPAPIPGKQKVLDYVIQDLKDRAEQGKKKYGTYLETFNGRDAEWDAYQEALDLVMYFRQKLLERDKKLPKCCAHMTKVDPLGYDLVCPICGRHIP